MPAPKRSRKVVPLKSRGGGLTGRDGAIDFAVRTAAAQRTAVKPGGSRLSGDRAGRHLGGEHRGRHRLGDRAGQLARLRNLRWFEVVRTSGHISDGAVQHYQVTMKVGFTMEDAG